VIAGRAGSDRARHPKRVWFREHASDMLDTGLLAFVRASLPAPPADVLEIGAGQGELAAALRSAGYQVRAIDPAAEDGSQVERLTLIEAEGSFDAAVAVVSLHHVEPLTASCAHLAGLLRPGGRLVIDEFDVACLDERAASWWIAQRRALGDEVGHDPASLVEAHREHIQPVSAIRDALRPFFALGEPVPGPYLHRWNLPPGLRDTEEHLIATGELPATGSRLIGTRLPA
jgi:SAM-dependent methyltransferase